MGDPEERWQGLLPAEMAKRSGMQYIADVIEQLVWRRVQLLLAKHRKSARCANQHAPPLLACREDLFDLVCKFLAPPCGLCETPPTFGMLAGSACDFHLQLHGSCESVRD